VFRDLGTALVVTTLLVVVSAGTSVMSVTTMGWIEGLDPDAEARVIAPRASPPVVPAASTIFQVGFFTALLVLGGGTRGSTVSASRCGEIGVGPR